MGTPFFLAPMAEISHRAFRELIEDFGGCDCYFTEMISAPALLAGGPFEKWYIDSGPCPEKCVFQLVGSDPQAIAGAAAILDKLECAGIDINMGCSAPLIRKSGAGAAWMASIDRAGELISQVRPQVKRRLSVKLRAGFKDDFEYLARFCRRLEEEGVDLITLHPRTVMQKFKRLARWEYVGALRQELKIPVAGNGDIADAQQLIRRASGPCDAVMAGRAAVQMPWIFAQAREEDIFHGVSRSRGEGLAADFRRVIQSEREINVYDGEAILDTFSRCPQAREPRALEIQSLEFPAEGDRTSEGRERLRRRTPPNVFSGRAAPGLEEIGIRFIDLLIQYQPREFHISRARRFFYYFCDNLQWGTYLKNQINREESLAGVERVWKNYFKEQGIG